MANRPRTITKTAWKNRSSKSNTRAVIRVISRLMKIEEKVREIMLSEELSSSEKRDRLRALIPADVCKIDNLNKATQATERSPRSGRSVATTQRRSSEKETKNSPTASWMSSSTERPLASLA